MYVALQRGRVSRLTGFRWPEPGRWVEADGDAPADAIRGFPVDELPWWLDDELWALELAGTVATAERARAGSRGRLLRRIDAWTSDVADELTVACAYAVRDAAVEVLGANGAAAEAALLADAGDAELEGQASTVAAAVPGEPGRLAGFVADVSSYARDGGGGARGAAVAAYIAAHALAGGDKTVPGYDARFERERRWQVDWLRERLEL